MPQSERIGVRNFFLSLFYTKKGWKVIPTGWKTHTKKLNKYSYNEPIYISLKIILIFKEIDIWLRYIYTIFQRNKVASDPPTVITYISSNRNLMATIAVEAVFSSMNSARGVVQGYWNMRRLPWASPEMTLVRWLPICTAVVVVGSFL